MSTPTDGETLERLPVEPLMTPAYEIRRAEVHDRLRRRWGAVAPVDLLGQRAWLVLGYPEAVSVLSDESRWKKSLTHWRAYTEGRVPPDWPLLTALIGDMVIYYDDERRAAARAAVEAALDPFQDLAHPSAQELRRVTARYADELITFFSHGGGGGTADLCAQYTRPLPLMVANRMLGFPVARGDEMIMDMWRVLDAGPDAAAAAERILADLRALVEEKRVRPGDDLPSRLVAHDPSAPTPQLAWTLGFLLVNIIDTTGSLLANTVVEALGEDLAGHTGLEVGHYDEIIEHAATANPPMHTLSFRFPVAPTPLGRFVIAPGDPVMVSPAAAHTCPHFTGGEGRPAAAPSRAHLAWGAGVHGCAARELATMIVRTGVERLFARLTDLRLAMPADQLPWRSSPIYTGLRAMPVRYAVAPVRPPSGPAAASPVPAPGAAPAGVAEAAEPAESRSALWRLLAALRRAAGGG